LSRRPNRNGSGQGSAQHTQRLLSQQPPPALFAPRCAQRPPLSPRAFCPPAAVFRPSAVLSVSIAATDSRLSLAVRGPHLRRRASEILPQSHTSRPTRLPPSIPQNILATSPTSLRWPQPLRHPSPSSPHSPPNTPQTPPPLFSHGKATRCVHLSFCLFPRSPHLRFNIYIYDYCHKRGFKKTARELLIEADIAPESMPPINARQGLLFE